ncbi:MAG: rhomboid family intramembrane serine protease [Candidatus Nanosalina sp.]
MSLRENASALELSAVLVVVFAFQVFFGFDPAFQAGESAWWKFFTSFLGHSGMEHLFNNLFFIALFGTMYRSFTSEKFFWATFLVSAITANLTAFIFYPNSPIIGASGGAMGLLAALAVYRPRKPGLALGVPLPMYMTLIVYLFINFFGITGSSSVAYEAHLFGLFTGAAFGFWLRKKERQRKKREKEERKNRRKGREVEEEEDSWRERIRQWEEKYMM